MDSEGVVRDQTVLVSDGVIAEIGPSRSVKLQRGIRRIDAAGGYLLPGLVDAHVHLRDVSELLSYLAYGVTTVVHLSGSVPGGPDVLTLRGRVSRGEVPGPSIYASGPILDGDPPIYPAVSVVVKTEQDARRAVVAQARAGFDFIKVYNNLPAAALREAVTAAHEANKAVFGHIPRVDGRSEALQRALEAKLDVIAHGEEYFFTYFYDGVERQLDGGQVPAVDEEAIGDAVRRTKDASAAVIPNLSFVAMTRAQLNDLSRVLGDEEFQFLAPSVREAWKQGNPTTRRDLERFDRRERGKYPFVQKLTRALQEGGVPLLVGTDASAPGLFPGRSVHEELRELVSAGLTAWQALAAGTRTPGAFLAGRRGPAPFGTITKGSRADMILLRRNPMDDIENVASIEGVMVRGAWFSKDELERMRKDARGAAEIAAPR